MSDIKARPTLYKGIKMRSRLEADYAANCDRSGESWDYEPACFASDAGQWLPDFRVGASKTLVELKPAYLLECQGDESGGAAAERIDTILRRMTIAWHSEPDSFLELIFWTYGGSEPVFSILGHPTRPWMAFGAGLPPFPLIWIGMGQLAPVMRELPTFRKEAS